MADDFAGPVDRGAAFSVGRPVGEVDDGYAEEAGDVASGDDVASGSGEGEAGKVDGVDADPVGDVVEGVSDPVGVRR